MIIETMLGMGDNLFFRPVLKWLPTQSISLITHWPQVYHDIPGVRFIRPMNMKLRTQRDNALIQCYDSEWCPPDYSLSYNYDLGTPLHNFFSIMYGSQPTWVDNSMSVPQSWIEKARSLIIEPEKPICLIRPNTLRTEWMCPARNPKTEYLQRFIDKYQDKFWFISLANLCPNEEFLDGELHGLDIKILNTTYEETVGLFYLSKIIVCSPSFWVPLGQILNKTMIIIYGAHEPHWKINDRRVKAPNTFIIEPIPFDRCSIKKQTAYKHIDEDVLDMAFKEATRCCTFDVA